MEACELRVCSSCFWIFRDKSYVGTCPKCGSKTYGAHRSFGPKCYRYAETQEPWMNNHLLKTQLRLAEEITASQED